MTTISTPAIANQMPPPTDVSSLSQRGMPPPPAPMSRGLSRPVEAGEQREERAGHEDGGEIEIAVPTSSMQREPAHAGGRDREEDRSP